MDWRNLLVILALVWVVVAENRGRSRDIDYDPTFDTNPVNRTNGGWCVP